MFNKTLPPLLVLLTGVAALGQTKSYQSPNRTVQAIIVPAGAQGYESYESRVEIRSSSGALLRSKSFASRDHNHGEGVGHAEWTLDGRFFVFNTNSSGGHQPWHFATYFYSVSANKIYSVDAIAGAITSDFALLGNTLSATRMGVNADQKVPITIHLTRWR